MVKAIRKLGFLAALGFAVAISASGQARGFSAPMRGFSAPMRGIAGRSFSRLRHGFSGPRQSRRGIFGPGTCGALVPGPCGTGFAAPPLTGAPLTGTPLLGTPLTGTPLNPNFGVVNGVPGLGFDYPHLAAISRGFQNQFGFANNGFLNNSGFIPFFGGLPYSYPPYDEEGPDNYAETGQQPQFMMPSPQQPMALPPAETAPSAPAATPQIPPPPPPELGQLILVRRDGQVLLAVAFTARNGQLTYITNEGARRSFPISELDKDATRQMNDASGTSVSLPN